ncbi:glycosyltransferase family 39 protein [Planctomicrobium piriforme]|uniref:Dolichyl-phosphate-mannose-protein mannosyltransferase n=1 Tax=Planctomicrobium piriforme TaxID=1576369 RepID=A0A1I3GPK7_9PLAN|nr:glycosyltransferase family 39 protein [Planctomicrobium piriforme]SFI25346.1 Dolichyl-phosphate-mannose-protein mannosyltransferase [Planctomicrobium piriforme]
MKPKFNRQPSERLLLAALLLIGLLLRIAVTAFSYENLLTDPDAYLTLAQGIAAGHGFAVPGSEVPTAFRPPLYPLLISWCAQPSQRFLLAAFQIAISLATLPVVWLCAKQLGLGKFARLAAVACLAIDPLLLRYVPFPMTETTCALLVACLLLCMTSPAKPTARRSFVTGVVFGLCVLSRPTFWAFGAFYAGYAFAVFAASSSRGWEIPWKRLIAGLAGIVLCVSPWAIRNAQVLGKPIVMTTHGGYTLLLGNNEAFYREVVRQPFGTIWDGSKGPGQSAWMDSVEAERHLAGISGEVEADRWMSAKAWDTILLDPVTFQKACLLKFCWFWNIAPHAAAAPSLSAIVRYAVGIYYVGLWLCLLGGMFRLVERWSYGEPGLSQNLSSKAIGPSGGDADISGSHDNFAPHPLPLSPEYRGEGRPHSLSQWRAPVLLVLAMTCAHLLYWSDARMRAPIMPAVALIAVAAFAGPSKSGTATPAEQSIGTY